MYDKNAPAAKGDIADLDEKFELLRSEMSHGYKRIAEKIHDCQTALLKAFHEYAEINDKRTAELEVERRLNMPPAA